MRKALLALLAVMFMVSIVSAGQWERFPQSLLVNRASKVADTVDGKRVVKYVLKDAEGNDVVIKTVVISDRISAIDAKISSLQTQITDLQAEKTELEALQSGG
jgi:peptidoglycan hydrolase CwlO-like protein